MMPSECYRHIDGHDLFIDVFLPTGTPSAAMVFFHGGGWKRGDRSQMHPWCQALADRGMVAASASYRLLDQQAGDVRACIDDARAAMVWLRAQAGRFGFDPLRLAAGGGSAGGHLAACCGIIPAPCWPASRPAALVLYNPVIDQGPGGFAYKRIGASYAEVSPLHRIADGCPPACFLVGTADDGIPVATGVDFQARMQAAGGRCDLHLFGGQSHGFYRPEREGGRYHEAMAATIAFLGGLGFLRQETNAQSAIT